MFFLNFPFFYSNVTKQSNKQVLLDNEFDHNQSHQC